MEKNVVLTLEEYKTLTEIAALAAQLMDKYAEAYKGDEYVTESKGCFHEYKSLLHRLLYMDDDVKNDVRDLLPENYDKKHPDSILVDPGMEF